MSQFLYFIAAVVLLIGLLYVGGYIGHTDSSSVIATTQDMNQVISNSDSSGGCSSCKWY